MFKVIRKRKGHIQGYYRPEKPVGHQRELLLFALFTAGLLAGAWTIRNNSDVLPDRLTSLFQNYVQIKAEQSAWVLLNNAFLRRLLVLLTTFLTGASAFGAVFLYLMPCIYGTCVGIVSAYLYRTYLLKGIGYCALLLYPAEILFIAALLFAGASGIAMSEQLMQSLCAKTDAVDGQFRRYCKQYLIWCTIAAVSAVSETALHMIFISYFHFD